MVRQHAMANQHDNNNMQMEQVCKYLPYVHDKALKPSIHGAKNIFIHTHSLGTSDYMS